jgi:hypothetical protein
MVDVKNNDIRMTRGDTCVLDLAIVNEEGTPYTITDDDVILFTVKRTTSNKDVILQKTVAGGKITINPKETASLDYGTYCYDVELRRSDGFVATIITPHILVLTEEVTF